MNRVVPTFRVASSMRSGTINEIALRMMKVMITLDAIDGAIGGFLVGFPVQRHPDVKNCPVSCRE